MVALHFQQHAQKAEGDNTWSSLALATRNIGLRPLAKKNGHPSSSKWMEPSVLIMKATGIYLSSRSIITFVSPNFALFDSSVQSHEVLYLL